MGISTSSNQLRLSHSENADETLLELARAGDRRAFNELWHRYARLTVVSILPLAKSDAEDIVSEAFLSIWEQLQRGIGPKDNFRGYLLTVARNMCVKAYRHHSKVMTNVDLDSEAQYPTVTSIHDLCEEQHEHDNILSAFTELPNRWQHVLWMTAVDEIPRSEVARVLGLTPNAVSAITARAKEGLRTAWLEQQLPGREQLEHPEIAQLLPRYLRKSLPRAKTSSVRTHLASCTPCSLQLRSLREEDRRLGGRKGASAMLVGVLATGGFLTHNTQPAVAATPLVQAAWQNTLQSTQQRFASLKHSLSTFSPATLTAGTLSVIATGSIIASVIVTPTAPIRATEERSAPIVSESRPKDGATSEEPGEDSVPSNSPDDDARPEPTHPFDDANSTTSPHEPERIDSDASISEPTSTSQPPATSSPSDPPLADPQQPSRRPLTVHTRDAYDGLIAPLLTGTATAGATVTALVSGRLLSSVASAKGNWVLDLSELDLLEGVHTAVITQEGQDSTESVTFALHVPVAELATWPSKESDPPNVFPPFVVTFHGAPGAHVCPRVYTGMWNAVTLDEQGSGSTPMFYAWPFSSFGFGYCEGDRYGAAGTLATIP